MFILIEDLGFKKSSGLMPRLSFFLYFRSKLTGKRRLFTIPHTIIESQSEVSSDPNIKSKQFLRVGVGSTFVIRWYSFIINAMFFVFVFVFFFVYSNLLLVHLRLKQSKRVFFFFSVRMTEKNNLQGRCCYQAETKVSVFSRKP